SVPSIENCPPFSVSHFWGALHFSLPCPPEQNIKETPVTDSKDMTIKDVRVTVLRMPWANPDWIKGHALGPDRGILIVDVETAGGITGMGYLFHFRSGLKSIAAFLDEVVIPRVKGKDATAVEAIWRDLWNFTMTYGRGGIACMAMSALDIALWDAVGKRAMSKADIKM